MVTHEVVGLMAIWKHDAYPYFLVGEVTHMNGKGEVETVEYGGGYFKPIQVLPLAYLVERKNLIEKLRGVEARAKVGLNDTLQAELITWVPKELLSLIKRG